ncbi:MAG: MBL fold metallo-hydrolase [Candidatus Thiodiazotropha sp.]|jgi:hydroxyacylglutathione hydrolase
MRYAIIPVTPFQQNCTFFWCEKTLHTAIIDPGGDIPVIMTELNHYGLIAERILLTHGHIDHAAGAAELAEKLRLPIDGPHPDDAFWLDSMAQQASMFGFSEARICQPDRWLQEGDEVTVGEERLEVIHCPGHTPGHLVFYHPEESLAQVGDVLFKGSIGRTDFPKGDYNTLISSIREKLFPLGDEVRFIPGHGPMSTFGEERRSNPFVHD